MKTKVIFNDAGEVTEIKVKASRETVAYAEMNSSGAYITTVYPFKGCEGITPDQLNDIVEALETLPFVEYAKFNYKP